LLSEEADEALMVRYQKGETRAFEILLQRHQKPLFNFVLRFVGAREQAEDVVQEVFLRVIKAAASYQAQAKFTTWLYTIARNLCTDQSRRAKHRKTRSLDQSMSGEAEGQSLHDVVASSAAGADRSLMDAQFRERLMGALGSLADEQREVFLLREVAGLPFKDIADVVGAPENTVKSRMRYALEKLREQLADFHDHPHPALPLEGGGKREGVVKTK
jgi:RNA polymerase sigma-70 factor (ECF subfamily)